VNPTVAAGKFDFVDKVWGLFAKQTPKQQQSYAVYKALSDEHGCEAWQPAIEQKCGKLYYQGNHEISRERFES
jgi:hypothetical protein